MANLSGNTGLKLKLLVALLAFALVPMASIGLLSIMEMNRAAEDVQEKITGLSSTLNRSAFASASIETDQVQMAVAKAGWYDEFFRNIGLENEVIATYASDNRDNQSCAIPLGVWIAPLGANETSLQRSKQTLTHLCAPSRVLQTIVKTEPSCIMGYIGTDDGVLVTWPDYNEMLSRISPYDHRKQAPYLAARSSGKTIWTDPYINSRGSLVITCATPIYNSGRFFGVAAMEISLDDMHDDLSSLWGRGYPFIINNSGAVIMRSRSSPRGSLSMLFQSNNFFQSNNLEVRELGRIMARGETGSSVVGFGNSDGYVAFAPIRSMGWSIGIAYPAEEMSLPARFIDIGIRDTAKGVSQGLIAAIENIRKFAAIILILTIIVGMASVFIIIGKIEGQSRNMAEAAERIRNGDLDITATSKESLDLINSIKSYIIEHEAIAESRGAGKKEQEFRSEVKRSLQPAEIRKPEGYEVVALSIPSTNTGFDFCDVINVGENKLALYMAEVSEGGLKGAMLAIASSSLIRSLRSPDPAKAMSNVNLQISNHAQGVNLSCFYAVLDSDGSTMEFVNAGFNPAFIVDHGGSVDTLGGGGIALGAIDRLDLQPERIPIQPGDVFIVFSDGVTEAVNAWRPQKGAERLITLVKENRLLSGQEILGAIEKEIRIFLRDNSLKHDSALMILKRL